MGERYQLKGSRDASFATGRRAEINGDTEQLGMAAVVVGGKAPRENVRCEERENKRVVVWQQLSRKREKHPRSLGFHARSYWWLDVSFGNFF